MITTNWQECDEHEETVMKQNKVQFHHTIHINYFDNPTLSIRSLESLLKICINSMRVKLKY